MDTSECGELSSCTVLEPFAESGQYAAFGADGECHIHRCKGIQFVVQTYSDNDHKKQHCRLMQRVSKCVVSLGSLFTDCLNYSINVYERGSVLSIVSAAGQTSNDYIMLIVYEHAFLPSVGTASLWFACVCVTYTSQLALPVCGLHILVTPFQRLCDTVHVKSILCIHRACARTYMYTCYKHSTP